MNSSPALGPAAKPGSIGSIESDDGTSHGSDELARNVSDRRITGVRYLTAIRAASMAASKQPEGVAGAMIGSGDSPWRPSRQLVKELGRGGDRIRRVEQRQLRLDAGRDEAVRERRRAVDVSVETRLRGRRRDLVLDREQLGRLTEVVARAEGVEVRVPD